MEGVGHPAFRCARGWGTRTVPTAEPAAFVPHPWKGWGTQSVHQLACVSAVYDPVLRVTWFSLRFLPLWYVRR